MRFALFFLLFSDLLSAQSQPSWRHFTIDDGLPDNKIYGMAEDAQGFLWFSTSVGVCRFNGYKFEQFPGPDMVNKVDAFFPQTDANDRLWFRWLNGKLFYFERDSIRPWQHNNLIDSLKGRIGFSPEFGFWPDGSVLLRLTNIGFLLVHPDGRSETIQSKEGETLLGSFEFGLRISTHSLSPERSLGLRQRFFDKKMFLPITLLRENGTRDSIPSLPLGRPDESITMGLQLGRDSVLLFGHYGIWLWSDGRLIKSLLGNPKSPPLSYTNIQKLRDGRFYVSKSQAGAGLYIYPDLQALLEGRPSETLLVGKAVNNAWLDRQGNLWATTLDDGLYFRINAGIALWNNKNGLSNDKIVHLIMGGNALFLSTSDDHVFRFDLSNNELQDLNFPVKTFINYLYFDPLAQNLLVCANGMKSPMIWNGRFWKEMQTYSEANRERPAVFVRQVLRTRDGSHYFGISYGGVEKVQFSTGKILNQGENLISARLIGITETPEGQILGTQPAGLQLWDGKNLRPIPGFPGKPIRRVGALLWLKDSTLAIGSFVNGLSLWKRNDLRQISLHEGLPSDAINDLAVQGDSIIWINHFNLGLGKVMGWHTGETLKVGRVSRAQGLPTNEVADICVASGFLWVATSAGLVRLQNVPVSTLRPKPVLHGILVNGIKQPSLKSEFQSSESNLEFHFFAINFRQNGHVPYRFRLGQDQPWQQTTNTSAFFLSLKPNEYRFEVQAQNEDEIWSESTVFTFEIRPPWWKTWWFRSIVLGLAAAVAMVFYQWRTRHLKAQFAIQKQMAELEQTALRAQMNPHFIANCLNSIQRCVLENNNEAAVRYLTRFGKLTRTALEFSGRPQISLAEEITYLENYLALEKLRFKEKFDFKIKVSSDLDSRKTMIPPMLIQPLVENAIKHGFVKTESGGLIDIAFTSLEQGLQVHCRDNGLGFVQEDLQKTTGEAHAIDLINRRLTLLRKSGQDISFSLQNRIDGQKGTDAVLFFRT